VSNSVRIYEYVVLRVIPRQSRAFSDIASTCDLMPRLVSNDTWQCTLVIEENVQTMGPIQDSVLLSQ
jgi:hypothetical protein